MNFFNAFQGKLSLLLGHQGGPISLEGINIEQWPIFFELQYKNNKKFSENSHILICPTIDEAEIVYESLRMALPSAPVYFFPGLETSPYGGILASELNLYKRFKILDLLCHPNSHAIIICHLEAFYLNLPPPSFFKEKTIFIKREDILPPRDLATKLVSLGYSSTISAEEPGTFAQKGEIFDIYPLSHPPVRLTYFDDLIEHIYKIDLKTQKTIRDNDYTEIYISPTPVVLTQNEFTLKLREAIPMPGPAQKERFAKRRHILELLSEGRLFENYPAYAPLFFEQSFQILNYFSHNQLCIHLLNEFNLNCGINEWWEELRIEYEKIHEDNENDSLLPPPLKLYAPFDFEKIKKEIAILKINPLGVTKNITTDLTEQMSIHLEESRAFLARFMNVTVPKHEFIKTLFEVIKTNFEYSGNIVFCVTSTATQDELKYLLDIHNINSSIKDRIHFCSHPLAHGFYYEAEKILYLTEAEIFSQKKKSIRKTPTRKLDLFAEQLATLKPGDYVIHNEHGVGKYQGLESLDIGGTSTDYLVILYTENDKVYVPVYRMNQIQKHAEATAELSLANLRTNKFLLLKERAKGAAKELAFDLLRLQAERQSSAAFSFSPPDHQYKEFELAFPFSETPDQSKAIEDVLEGMQKPIPMDHLVCGDVGFGKTEVAMRASFKAVLDKKQVAVLVPTTILALQHYNSFVSRYKEFPVNIQFLSRFKTAPEVKKIKEEVSEGKIDIIIGTHKILADDLKFKDLGLVIVDEEQRFGVGHKEKLKLMKSSVDFLTLTATPIPRTLQLAFLGLRDLSLIQTAPPKRQSIKTYLIKDDDYTIQQALKKELSRGGQVFFVHNRVNDIEEVAGRIRELVPEARILIAHGQLPEKDLEKRMKDFYSGAYQILLSTTIIESGLDIPNANTIIINRADTFGLSQLHQLRGRIGRSDKKAYAYFVIPQSKNLSAIAERRLQALQTYAEMGSGFSLASCDLEIRGAGDILGGSQSGHIEAVGLELYMELLKEAIAELRGERKVLRRDIEFSTPFAAHLPHHYLADPAERLRYYKKISNCETHKDVSDLREEMEDIFGQLPEEARNLFSLIECRIHLQRVGLKSLQVAGNAINMRFDKNFVDSNSDLRDSIVKVFMARPKVYQITPDYRVVYNHKERIGQETLLTFAKDIAQQILPC